MIDQDSRDRTWLAMRIAALLLLATMLFFPTPSGWLWYAALTVVMPAALLWSPAYAGVLEHWAKTHTWLAGKTISELCARAIDLIASLCETSSRTQPAAGPGGGSHEPRYRSCILSSSRLLRAPPLLLA